MAEQYWIGGFYIDLSRNQITQNTQSQVIAPKALAVLTYLAENQGTVVSHDKLLEKVWQGTVVSTNTLQRSIAQLRKALGDNGKTYIKTHAKQGYSLECAVRWSEDADSLTVTSTSNDSVSAEPALVDSNKSDDIQQQAAYEIQVIENRAEQTASSEAINHADKSGALATPQASSFSASGLRKMSITLVLLILGLIGYQYLGDKQSAPFEVSELRALTSTDDKELASIYSPDGQYIVFHRFSEEFCVNNVWAKNTKTQQEFQLTKDLDTYGSHSFSNDGKQLVFIKTGGCSQPVLDKKCYRLMSLDFTKALLSPQSPVILMECVNSQIRTPIWLDNDNILLLQRLSDRWKLISYSVSDNKSHDLYALDDGNIIDYDYSVADGLIALTSIHDDGYYYIEVLNTDGQLLSSHRIEYPPEIANSRLIYPNFSPIKNQLIFSTGRQLFTLSFDGQVTNISVPLDQPIGTPTFHPDGNKMLVIKGHYDSDIVSLPRSQVTQIDTSPSKQNDNSTVIARSILSEDNAILQPNGELIAYQSVRSGEEQLWIADDNGARQLTNFPMDTYIGGMGWAADGNSILVNANNVLTQVYLDSTQNAVALQYPVSRLFQWDSKNNSALALVRIKGVLRFVELNLTNASTRIINHKRVTWALKSESGQIIYKDHMDRFWRPGPAEEQPITALDGQGRARSGFLLKDNVIYGVNEDFQLWSYGLDHQRFEIIGKLPHNIDDLNDINETTLLLTVRISAAKEVAELSLKD